MAKINLGRVKFSFEETGITIQTIVKMTLFGLITLYGFVLILTYQMVTITMLQVIKTQVISGLEHSQMTLTLEEVITY